MNQVPGKRVRVNNNTNTEALRRPHLLCWMAGLAVAGGDLNKAEGYLLELLAWCAFATHTEVAS
jgi:hypothetical protein